MSETRGWPRCVAFLAVGAIGFGVQLAALAWLTDVWRMPAALAAAVAVEIAVLHNFAWHERWTWRDRADGDSARTLARLARFNLGVGVVSVVGNLAITVAAVEWMHLPVVVANACAVVAMSLANYLLADRCVFRPEWNRHGHCVRAAAVHD